MLKILVLLCHLDTFSYGHSLPVCMWSNRLSQWRRWSCSLSTVPWVLPSVTKQFEIPFHILFQYWYSTYWILWLPPCDNHLVTNIGYCDYFALVPRYAQYPICTAIDYLRQIVHSCHPSFPVAESICSLLRNYNRCFSLPCVFKYCGVLKVEGGEGNVFFIGIICVLAIVLEIHFKWSKFHGQFY